MVQGKVKRGKHVCGNEITTGLRQFLQVYAEYKRSEEEGIIRKVQEV